MMRDPVGFFLLLAVAAFAIVSAIIGLRRGKAVTFFKDDSRERSPGKFWYSIIFQLGIGIVCLVTAITKIFE